MSAFYSIMFVENLILLGVWFPFRLDRGWDDFALLATVFGGFFTGELIICNSIHQSYPMKTVQGSVVYGRLGVLQKGRRAEESYLVTHFIMCRCAYF